MKIRFGHISKSVTVKEIAYGGCFYLNGGYYMKVTTFPYKDDDDDDPFVYIVNLKDGRTRKAAEGWKVLPVEAEVVVTQ